MIELGAGTGKLTRLLVELGHDVHAIDADPEMLRVLQENCPGVRTSLAPAEAIPAPDRSADVVVAAHSFHCFDTETALPEIARVLKPGGHLALVWNERDERIPWVRRLGRILGNTGHEVSADAVVQSGLFGYVDQESFGFWQLIDAVSIMDLARSDSDIASMSEDAQQARLAEVAEFYAEYGRGMDGMQLPYRSHCFRARVAERSAISPSDTANPGPKSGWPPPGGDASPTPPPADGDTGEFLLIDFR